MKKFVIIEHEPLTVRLRNIWNISELQKKGVNVEYWDISPYIFPGINIPNKVYSGYVRILYSIDDIESAIAQNDVTNTIFVIEVSPKWDNRKIFTLLHKYNCFRVKIDLYANTTIPVSLKKRIKSSLKRFSFVSLIKKCLWSSYVRFYIKNTYNLTLSSSSIANPDIKINHPDFELFNQISPAVLTKGYILFIDIYYPLHPDIKYHSKLRKINELANGYRQTMISFFDYLSNRYKKEVVIAAHPKSDYVGKEFGDRMIIRDNTCALIKNADMVITHGSNALSFIALANKPFMITYPDSFRQVSMMYEYVNNLASYCKMPAYNLDKDSWDNFSFNFMDKETRDTYIYKFLTSYETEKMNNAEIWIEKLLKAN